VIVGDGFTTTTFKRDDHAFRVVVRFEELDICAVLSRPLALHLHEVTGLHQSVDDPFDTRLLVRVVRVKLKHGADRVASPCAAFRLCVISPFARCDGGLRLGDVGLGKIVKRARPVAPTTTPKSSPLASLTPTLRYHFTLRLRRWTFVLPIFDQKYSPSSTPAFLA
jgi:hypothetical protein